MTAPDTRPETRAEPVAWKTWCAECESIYVTFELDDDECHICGGTLTDPSPLYAQPGAVAALLQKIADPTVVRCVGWGRCDMIEPCGGCVARRLARSALTTDEEGG